MHKLTVKQRGLERSALVVRGRTTIAEVFTDREPGDQYQTAELIAAAPDLLAALQLLVRGDGQPDECARAMRAARAAIAKATGADHA